MSTRVIDLTGQKFGRLTVIRQEGTNNLGSYLWLCKCECGTMKVIPGAELRRGRIRSCGCLNSELARERAYKHGFSRTKIYREWRKMKTRCDCNCSNIYYRQRYCERGIKVCDRWVNDFQAFYDDVSILPHFGEPGYSLDRIDNDGNYEVGNVRWADSITQANNRSNNILITYNGEIIEINKSSNLFRLLTQIQDEVHRFAITYFHNTHSKNLFSSSNV